MIAIVATLLVLKRLTLEGTSKDLKMQVFKKHLLYSILYILSLIQVLIHFFRQETVKIFS